MFQSMRPELSGSRGSSEQCCGSFETSNLKVLDAQQSPGFEDLEVSEPLREPLRT